MEHIKNIEIKNFKSIRHQKIEDCRRINVFIGYPNVGKSNILEALSLFCINDETKVTDFIRVKEDPTLFFNGFLSNTIDVKINNQYQISCKYSNTELEIAERYLESASHSPIIRGNVFRNFVYNRRIQSEVEVPEISVKKYEYRNDVVTKTTQYSTLDMPFGGNIFNIIQTNETLNDDASNLLKLYGLELLYDSGSQSFTIFKRINKGIFTVPYDLLADTIHRLIFYKAAVLSNKEAVLLFEEPEVHMFPPYISKLTSDVMYDDRNNQYFITTHSPFILNDFMEDLERDQLAIFAVGYKKETGETIVRKINDSELDEIYQYGIDLFFNLENYLINED